MQITNQILQIQLAPLPSGEGVFLSEENGARRRSIQATVRTEADLFALFQQFLSLSDVNQTCKFVYMSSNREQFGCVTEFSIRENASPQSELIAICQGAEELPSIKRLQSSMSVPWSIHSHEIFFSNTEESIDTLRTRFKRVFDYTMKSREVFDRELISLPPMGCSSHELRAFEILQQMIPEYKKSYTAYDELSALQPLSEKTITDQAFREAISYFSQKEVGGLSFSRISLLQGGEEPQKEEEEMELEDLLLSIGDLEELFAERPVYEKELEILAKENIFNQLHEAQEEKRIELQQKLTHQLDSRSQTKKTTLQDLFYCALHGATSRDIYTHNQEKISAVPDRHSLSLL